MQSTSFNFVSSYLYYGKLLLEPNLAVKTLNERIFISSVFLLLS